MCNIINININIIVFTYINIYSSDMKTPKYMKKTLTRLNGKIDHKTKIVGDFNTSFSIMERTSRKKINKKIRGFEQHYSPIGHYRYMQKKLHLTTSEYIFLKYTWNILQDTDIMQNNFSDHNEKKLEINSSRNT